MNPRETQERRELSDGARAILATEWSPPNLSSRVIEPRKQQRAACHYCGLPATSFGFFGEPICPECGA